MNACYFLLMLLFAQVVHQTEAVFWDLGIFLRCTNPREKFSPGGPEEGIQLLNLGWGFDLAGDLQMLILQMGRQRPQT